MRLGGSFSSGSGGSIGGGGGGSPRPQQETGSDQRQLEQLQRQAEQERQRLENEANAYAKMQEERAIKAAEEQAAREKAAQEAEQQRLQQVEADRKAQEAAAYQKQQEAQQLAQAQAAAEEKARFERAKQLAEQQQKYQDDTTTGAATASLFSGIPFNRRSDPGMPADWTPGDPVPDQYNLIGNKVSNLGSQAIEGLKNLSLMGQLGGLQTKPKDPNNLSLFDKFKMSLDKGVRDPVTNEVIYSPFSDPNTASYMNPNTFNYQGVANPYDDIKSLSFFGGNNNQEQAQAPAVNQTNNNKVGGVDAIANAAKGIDAFESNPGLYRGPITNQTIMDEADIDPFFQGEFGPNMMTGTNPINQGGGFAPEMMTGDSTTTPRSSLLGTAQNRGASRGAYYNLDMMRANPPLAGFDFDSQQKMYGDMRNEASLDNMMPPPVGEYYPQERGVNTPLIDPSIEYDDTGMPITPLTPEQIYSGKYAYSQANADPIMGGDINYAEASNRVGRSAPQKAPSQMSQQEYIAATNAGFRWNAKKGRWEVNLGRVMNNNYRPDEQVGMDPVVQAAGDAQTTMYRPDQQVGAYDVPFSDRNPGSGKLSPNVADPQGFLKRSLMDGNVETMNRGGVAGVYPDAPLRKVMEMNRKIKPRGMTDEQFLNMQIQARARAQAASQESLNMQRQAMAKSQQRRKNLIGLGLGLSGNPTAASMYTAYANDGGVVYANEGTPRTHNTISGMSKDVATPMGNFLDKFGLKSNLMRLLGYDANTQRTHKGLGAFDSYFPGYTERVFKEDGPLAKSKTTTTTVKEEYDTEGAGPKNYTSANEMGRPFKVNPNAGMRHSLTTPMVMPDLPLSNPNR